MLLSCSNLRDFHMKPPPCSSRSADVFEFNCIDAYIKIIMFQLGDTHVLLLIWPSINLLQFLCEKLWSKWCIQCGIHPNEVLRVQQFHKQRRSKLKGKYVSMVSIAGLAKHLTEKRSVSTQCIDYFWKCMCKVPVYPI